MYSRRSLLLLIILVLSLFMLLPSKTRADWTDYGSSQLLTSGAGYYTQFCTLDGAPTHWQAVYDYYPTDSYHIGTNESTGMDGSISPIWENDSYTWTGWTAPSNCSVLNVTFQYIQAQSLSNTYKGTIAGLVNDDGVIAKTSTALPTTTLANFTFVFLTNPFTEINWTYTDITHVEFGVTGKSGMYYNPRTDKTGFYYVSVGCVRITVYYSVPHTEISAEWHSIYATFNLLTREWQEITGTFDLTTRQWNPLINWFNLDTREWNPILNYFLLTAKGWNSLLAWFELGYIGWHSLIVSFILSLTETTIAVLFIGLLFLASLITLIIFMKFRRR